MYDDLVKRLRICPDYNDGCVNCQHEHDLGCRTTTMREAADAIEGLSNAVDKMTEWRKNPWIPVTERLPSNSTKVLVFEFGRVEQAYTTTYTADGSLCWVVINGGSYHRISDADCPIKWWMPLPEPPKEENKCKSGNM